MFCRARAFVIALTLLLMASAAVAQTMPDPTLTPTVTADSTSWFLAGDPVDWSGNLYYPRGATQFFNPAQMVRSGSFKGIPLYTDPARQPNSVVFVPLSQGRVQPYERAVPDTVTMPAAPPSGPARMVTAMSPAPEPVAVGTSGRAIAAAPAPRVTTLQRPTGLNNIWIKFDGRRWFAAGKAIDYDAATLTRIGTYRGWSVYTRNGDAATIYIPGTPGRLTPYRAR